jgi:nuclear transport factor 2 (NTF2) superfamily protein
MYPCDYPARCKFTLEGFRKFKHVAIIYAQDLFWRNSVDLLLVQDTYFKRIETKSRKRRVSC